MRMIAPRTPLFFLAILAAGLLLVACGRNGANVETAAPQVILSEAPTLVISEAPTETLPLAPETKTPSTNEAGTGYPPPAPPAATSTTPAGGYPAPTEPPVVKTDLQASDPALVQLASGKPQLVMFFAYSCETCKNMAPIVHELESEYGGKVGFVYLDINDPANDSFKDMLGYQSEPHMFVVDGDGKILNQWLGSVTREELVTTFEAALAQ